MLTLTDARFVGEIAAHSPAAVRIFEKYEIHLEKHILFSRAAAV